MSYIRVTSITRNGRDHKITYLDINGKVDSNAVKDATSLLSKKLCTFSAGMASRFVMYRNFCGISVSIVVAGQVGDLEEEKMQSHRTGYMLVERRPLAYTA